MRIVPAVDIRGGLCVNLVQGDYGAETVFGDDPVAQATAWRESGGEIIHIVDLDGAKAGHLCVAKELKAMADANIPLEVGGGIRTMETIAEVIDLGAERVILGTAAFKDPALVKEAAEKFPGQIVVGIDAKDGHVALSGWLEETTTEAAAFAQHMEQAGAARIIYTDILHDGMMKGPNLDATRAVAEAVNIPVTASGGMATLADVAHVADLEEVGVDEVIIGRALYLGVFTLPEAILAGRADA
jgi:phosphoribosylformimino-5-aminoimidazole carboxamide ribotide isomerase